MKNLFTIKTECIVCFNFYNFYISFNNFAESLQFFTKKNWFFKNIADQNPHKGKMVFLRIFVRIHCLHIINF